MANIPFIQNRAEFDRLIRFLSVGASGTLVDFAALTLMKEALGFPTLLANTLSFSLGIINNFTLNRLWTFSDARSKPAIRQFVQFFLVSVIGLLFSNILVLLLEYPLGTLLGAPALGYLPAKAIATIIVALWNFTANRYWTFNDAN